MKNVIIIISVIILIIISLFIGIFIGFNCKDKNEVSETIPNITAIEKPNNQKFYSKYEITGLNSDFDEIIRNNTIDKSLSDELEKKSTTIEYIETYDLYISIWKSELGKSLEMLEEYLNNEEKLELREIQKNWESLIDTNFQFEYDTIKNEEHDIFIGSSFNWLYEKSIMETYRQRTIDIKYLIYFLTYNAKDEIRLDMEF